MATDAEDRAKFLRPHVDRHKHKSATDMVCDVADIDWLLDEVDTLRRCNRLNLADLAAAEQRCKELEAENEWRGVLLKAIGSGCKLHSVKNCHGSTYWFDLLTAQGDVIVREIPRSFDDIPACPPDEVVAKIREALR